jgi:hypothetical protein
VEKTIPHTVFVDDGYPEADEFANNYRERASDLELKAASDAHAPSPVLARFRRLLGLDASAGTSRRA